MTRRRLLLQRLPIFGCAAFLGVMLLINVWNFFVSTDWPKLRIRSDSPLWGVGAPKPAPWTLDALISGETQKAVSSRMGQLQPVFPLAVRIRNQFLYSALGVSGAPDLVIGRDRQLFEKAYVDEFCARGAPPEPAFLDAWATRLRDIQNRVEAMGKRFHYVITPSKAARLSSALPAHVACLSMARGAAEKLAPYRAALDAHGVAYVDGAALMTQAAPQYPIDLFPRGGTHWNYLGAAIATQALTRELNKHGPSPIRPYEFEWSIAPEAEGTDMDLLRLLNLLWPDRRYPTARIYGRYAGPCDKTPKIFAAGGSFLIEMLANLVTASCPVSVDYWHYVRDDAGGFRRWRRLVENMDGFEHDLDPARETDADFAGGVYGADVVLLEENEKAIGHMGQVPDLLAAASK